MLPLPLITVPFLPLGIAPVVRPKMSPPLVFNSVLVSFLGRPRPRFSPAGAAFLGVPFGGRPRFLGPSLAAGSSPS